MQDRPTAQKMTSATEPLVAKTNCEQSEEEEAHEGKGTDD